MDKFFSKSAASAAALIAVLVAWTLLSAAFDSGFPIDISPLTGQAAARDKGGDQDSNSPGSDRSMHGVLQTCWSREDLEGRPAEAGATIVPVSSNIPPERLRPDAATSALSPELRNSIRSVRLPEGVKLVALTFDLCEAGTEKSGYDSRIVDYLRANSVKATFFAGGKWMRSHPERTMQLMADPLFEIGNHSWSHKNFRLLDKNAVLDQILWTQAEYELLWEQLQGKPCAIAAGADALKAIPRVPRLFRFPYGTCDPQSLEILASLGLPAIQWDVVSGDAAKGRSARGISEVIRSQVKPGSIVIFHANGRGHGTAEALPVVVSMLRQKGFEFVTVSELLRAGSIVAVPECYEMKPNDNLRYDRLFRR